MGKNSQSTSDNANLKLSVKVIATVRKELRKGSTPASRASSQRFFKNPVKCYGAKSSDVGRISKENFGLVQHLSKAELYKICEEFFKSGYCEEAWLAAGWVHRKKDYVESDFKIYERWIDKYVDDWAKCDVFCNHAVGELVEKFPKLIPGLKIWAKSKNLWLRRAAAVSLILPARNGKYLKDVFEIADILLMDKEDMVQKGYGWLLKEASRLHTKEVFDYVISYKDKMPRTSLRYAIEKMPESLRKKAMEK